jgi:hypothetical protein
MDVDKKRHSWKKGKGEKEEKGVNEQRKRETKITIIKVTRERRSRRLIFHVGHIYMYIKYLCMCLLCT